MKLRLVSCALVAISIGAAVSAPVLAQDRGRRFDRPPLHQSLTPDGARERVGRGQQMPLSEVLDAVRAQRPGRLQDVIENRAQGDRAVYRIRWSTPDGQLIDLVVDAGSGRILSEERPR